MITQCHFQYLVDNGMDISKLRVICQKEKFNALPRHPAYMVHRSLSIYLTAFFIRVGIGANTLSVFMIIMGVTGNAFLAFGNTIVGLATLYISFILDKCDGEVARYNNSVSRIGIYLDEIYHYYINSIIFSCIGLALINENHLYLSEGIFISYLYLLSRSEYKIFYTAVFKLPPRHDVTNVLLDHNLKIRKVIYWLSIPLQEDTILISLLACFIFQQLILFLHLYGILLVILIVLNILNSLTGGLEYRCSNSSKEGAKE